MSTPRPQAYDTRPPLHAGTSKSEKSYATVAEAAAKARIRSVLIARGSSLRAWGLAWGAARGLTDPAELRTAYNTVRMTVNRWAGRTDRPAPGTLSAEIMNALRADLGPWVIPSEDDTHRLAAPCRQPLTPPINRRSAERRHAERRQPGDLSDD